MQITKKQWIIAAVAGMAMLSVGACGNQPGAEDGQLGMQSVANKDAVPHGMHDVGIIPSEFGPKMNTTNEHGSTTSGMGMSVYSLMGSSSLHEGGISSHIKSRLTGEGIEDIKVFVVDDTVILARNKEQMTTNQYNRLQGEVLSPYAGISGKGVPHEERLIAGRESANQDSMAAAKKQIQDMFDGQVQVLMITNPQAVNIIDRITSKLHAAQSDSSIGSDINQLLQMAVPK